MLIKRLLRIVFVRFKFIFTWSYVILFELNKLDTWLEVILFKIAQRDQLMPAFEITDGNLTVLLDEYAYLELNKALPCC